MVLSKSPPAAAKAVKATGKTPVVATAPADSARSKAATGTVDLSLYLLEYLVASRKPVGVTDLAKAFNSSKPTVYRHIQALVKHGFARQDEETNRYEAGVKLLVLGELLRERFNILAAARNEMSLLREATGQAISLSALVNDEVITLELLQGRSVVEFGVKPGRKMDFHATAHGKVALAFGPPRLLENHCLEPLKSWTPGTIKTPQALRNAIKAIQKNGWATAANEIVGGVNAIAAPIFDHREAYAGAIAIIGSTSLIAAKPAKEFIDLVTAAAREVSRALGSRGLPPKGETV
ncbi:MAG: IclR family transcriptional regulator [Polaromonas sp.]|uniref:IclR family transcriptional regulator n=1 Tax=Polaromonas sp. TaxID=1869339 RepID=UPI0025DE10C3|nr:IclR family transcriptional regulator [Polaromonas sp.]MBI2727030.1 IclR family transcriptional regulator [Polaromonas sp.]